jgi:hypothetical protein
VCFTVQYIEFGTKSQDPPSPASQPPPPAVTTSVPVPTLASAPAPAAPAVGASTALTQSGHGAISRPIATGSSASKVFFHYAFHQNLVLKSSVSQCTVYDILFKHGDPLLTPFVLQ